MIQIINKEIERTKAKLKALENKKSFSVSNIEKELLAWSCANPNKMALYAYLLMTGEQYEWHKEDAIKGFFLHQDEKANWRAVHSSELFNITDYGNIIGRATNNNSKLIELFDSREIRKMWVQAISNSYDEINVSLKQFTQMLKRNNSELLIEYAKTVLGYNFYVYNNRKLKIPKHYFFIKAANMEGNEWC